VAMRGPMRCLIVSCITFFAYRFVYHHIVRNGETKTMLWTIIIILLVLWALGFGFAGQAVGSLIHILLIIAVIVLVLQLVRGRRGV